MRIDVAQLIDACSAAIDEHASHLTALDQAIGDGDHGINMQRGFKAVAEARDELAGLAIGEALQKVGTTLVMKVGGASGPLYGSFLMSFGKTLPASPNRTELIMALSAGIEAIKKRGRSNRGEKTLLDVLIPVHETLVECANTPDGETLERVQDSAEDALAATVPMRATKGRASFLGERSVGHEDPGAASSCLLIRRVCDTLASTS